MSSRIRLSEYSDWVREDGTAARGAIFSNEDNTLLRTDEIIDALQNCSSRRDVLEFLNDSEGHYSFVHHVDGEVVAAVDHVRSMPLFYLSDGSAVGDSTRALLGDVTCERFDPHSEAEYLLTSYVTGADTLLPSLKQIEAGGWISIDKETNRIRSGCHTEHFPTGGSMGRAELEKAIDNAIDRLRVLADGRPIYVLLSGGVDSRLILCALAKKQYRPLVALSYGREDCNDVTTGQWVADSIDVDWMPVEYTDTTWRRWFQSDERKEYYELTHNLDSLPGIAPCPAMSTLHSQDALPEDAIFVSGQTIASVGEHLPPKSITTRTGLIEFILDNHYDLWRRDEQVSESMKSRIDDRLPPTENRDDVVAGYEHWEWKERQGKFISQDGFSYSFWGYDWWFPLFDPQIMEVWGNLPADLRRDKTVLADIAADYFDDVATSDDVDVSKTDRNATLGSSIMFSVYESPLERFAWPMYTAYKRYTGIGENDLGLHGMFGKGQPGQYYSGIETHHSYRVMHATRRMSFDPPSAPGVPSDCTLRRSMFLQQSGGVPRTENSVYREKQ